MMVSADVAQATGGAVLSEVTEFNVFGASMWISASIIWWSIALAALAFVLWRRRQA